jgi:hypothetical protein
MTKTNDDGLRARMATLAKKKINELRAAYTRTTGKPANRLGRDALIKTLASLSDDAAPAAEKPTRASKAKRNDARPAIGSTIEKTFKGKKIRVEVTADGFRCENKTWSSLTALALHLTGYKAISGPAFFGLAKPATPKGTKE